MDPSTSEEIAAQVKLSLRRYGQAPTLRVDGPCLVLPLESGECTVNIEPLSTRWPQLNDAQRQRACDGLAAQLSTQRRTLTRNTRAKRPKNLSIPWAFGLAGLGIAATVGLAKKLNLPPFAAPPPTASAAAQRRGPPLNSKPTLPPLAVRAFRVCDATRLRVLRGATVGPTDVEGWMVEIALLRPAQASEWQRAADFLKLGDSSNTSRLVWASSPTLAQANGFNTGLSLDERTFASQSRASGAEASSPPAAVQRLVLSLYGDYVKAYFQERQRIELVRLAHALAKSYGAHLGGLYARCQGTDSHHVGGWFMGSDPALAATALLYFMGASAAPPFLPWQLLSPDETSPTDPALAVDRLQRLTASLDRTGLAQLVGPQDGTVAGSGSSQAGSDKFISVQFPYVTSNRALRASRTAAQALLEHNPQ